jgi:hypothetical protein
MTRSTTSTPTSETLIGTCDGDHLDHIVDDHGDDQHRYHDDRADDHQSLLGWIPHEARMVALVVLMFRCHTSARAITQSAIPCG